MFERAFATYCGTRDASGSAAGLHALRLGLAPRGSKRGDEVIVPAQTFVATAEAVSQLGAVPVIVDVLEDGTIGPSAVAAAVSPRTAGVLPVHLYGQMADMVAIARARRTGSGLACRGRLPGTRSQPRRASRAGVGGTACRVQLLSGQEPRRVRRRGRARDRTTRTWPTRVRVLREHGQSAKYHHEVAGRHGSARHDPGARAARDQAAAARRLERRAPRRRGDYAEMLAGVGDLELPRDAPGQRPGLAPVRGPHASPARRWRRSSPGAVSRTGCTTRADPPDAAPIRTSETRAGSCPVAERLADQCLSLPIYPGITRAADRDGGRDRP